MITAFYLASSIIYYFSNLNSLAYSSNCYSNKIAYCLLTILLLNELSLSVFLLESKEISSSF